MTLLCEPTPVISPRVRLKLTAQSASLKTIHHRGEHRACLDVSRLVGELGSIRGVPLISLGVSWDSCIFGRRLRPLERQSLDAVVHLIIHAQLFNRKRSKGGFAPVPVRLIRSLAGSLGEWAMDFLVAVKVVETDRHYIVGKKAKGYRFSHAALSWGFSPKRMPQRFARRLGQHLAERRRVTVNRGLAYADMYQTLRTVTLNPAIWPKLLNPPEGESPIQSLHRILAAFHIERANWYFTHDEKTGRCFCNVANFPSDLRQFLLIGGRPTGEDDIANSQPTLLVALAYKGQEQCEERAYALSLAKAGSFYATVCGWAGLGHLSHKEQKEEVFRGVLFARCPGRSPVWSGVDRHLQIMAEYITKSKGEVSKQRGIDASNALALRLQSLEADIMMGRVFPRLTAMGIAGISLHDGCLVAREHLEKARQVIEEEFEAATGILPTVRIK